MVAQGSRLYWQAWAGSAIAYLTYGWDAGVVGGILLTKSFQEAMHMPSVTTISMITSVFILGSWLGALIAATLGTVYGRRTCILLGNLQGIIGSLISATSYGPGQLIVGRVIMGMGNGFVTCMAPIYVAEMAIQIQDRGRGVYMLAAIAGIGVSAAYWVFPVAFQIVISFLSTALLYPLPDTPRWYYVKNRDEDGDEVLSRLCVNINERESYEKTKTEILASLELERENGKGERLRIKDIFWDTSATQSARRLRTGMIIYAIAQSQGGQFIFYYAATVFEKYLALPSITSSALSGALTTILAISAWVTLPFIEKAGRRKWLITGSCLQSIFLAIVTGLASNPSHNTSAAAAAFMFIYSVVLGATWLPFPIVYVSELMPLRFRHIGYCLSASVCYLFSWQLVFAAPISYTCGGSHGWTTWIWFLVFNVIGLPYVYFCCPETQGKTLEEIDLVFVSKKLRESTAGQKLIESTGTTSDTAEKS